MNSVVTLNIEQEIAVVQMQDHEAKNTFSRALIKGLMETFQVINANPQIKVVVIHGYDNYFCCGGAKEELLNIFSGKVTFADLDFYRLLLDCPVPTIAAMQGHAIGGGLIFGCYGDIIIFSEESIYSANFMKYGFTPGMGATYIVPKKLGELLGNEMLFSAKNYHGQTLKSRGISAEVVKKNDVVATAMSYARELAGKTRISLTLLKQHLTQQIKAELPRIIEQELVMHELTFAQLEVKERIEKLFGN